MTRSPSPRKKSPKKKTAGKPTAGRRFLRILFRVSLLLVFFLAGWMVYLDAQVTARFEGRRFEVPSRVYARPLELYEGASIGVSGLLQELELAGYRAGDGRRPGSFRRNGNRFLISTRGFVFPDGSEPGRRLELVLRNNQVRSMAVLEGPDSAIIRLEPAHIGGIYPEHREDRVLVRLEDVPGQLLATLLVVEDRDFYEHFGVAPTAIARAMIANLKAGRVVQGGSTLTQQLVKNFFLTREQTLVRKANEALMSVLLEWHYPKNDILETYLNEVYLGQAGNRSIHGFGLASQFYFGASLKDLGAHQIAQIGRAHV